MLAPTNPETMLDHALSALELDSGRRHDALDALPVPVYLTDPDGQVTYWNRACADFAGREPRLGQDRWCVTWRIYTTADELLPHDRCPMAVAVKERRAIRGEVAIAIRPDGSRKAFTPYPTPLFSDDGQLIGAINMLIDVSDKQAGALAEQADRCRRLAASISDRYSAEILRAMADGYERNAMALRRTDHLTVVHSQGQLHAS